MKKQDRVKLEIFSALEDEIIVRNATKRNLLLQNVRASKRKLTTIIAIAAVLAILVSTLSIFLIPTLMKQVPVYRGMTVANSNEMLTGTLTKSAVFLSGEHHSSDVGFVDGDYNKKPGEIDQSDPFDNKKPIESGIGSSLVEESSAKDLYYANAGEDIFITVHIDNPDKFEILSFTLNGYKYANNMFEYGSDLENLILKVNVGDVEGIVDYTIDAIKYVDGKKIKDVRMDGDKTVSIGVATDKQPTAALSGETVGYDRVAFTASVSDPLSLIQKQAGSLHAILYNGEEILYKKELSVGDSKVSFTKLSENTLYQYAIVATYDDLSGNGVASHVLAAKAFSTKSSAPLLFDSVTLTGTSASFSFLWNEGITPGTVTTLSLWQGEEKLRDLSSSDTEITDLNWGTTYILKAEYTANGTSDTISMSFRTVAKTEPTVVTENLKITKSSIAFAPQLNDPDAVGTLVSVALYQDNTLVETAEDLSLVVFDYLVSGTEYTVKFTYTFDLQDGNGTVTKVRDETYTTKVPDAESEGLIIESTILGYCVTGVGTCTDSVLVIPSEYNGKPVIGIDSQAFKDCTFIQSVTIPDSITFIKDDAFSGCTGITQVTVGNSTSSISFLLSCYNLGEVSLNCNFNSSMVSTLFRLTHLKSVNLSASDPSYESKNGIVYQRENNKVLFIPASCPDEFVSVVPPEEIDKTICSPIKNGIISKPYSEEPIYSATTNDLRPHLGIDIVPTTDDKNVYSAMAGIVTDVRDEFLMGLSIEIITGYNSTVFQYKGLASASVKVGDVLNAGDVIGLVGDSAMSEWVDGIHLHFEVSQGDPSNYIAIPDNKTLSDLSQYLEEACPLLQFDNSIVGFWRDNNGAVWDNVFRFVCDNSAFISDSNGTPGIRLTTPVAFYIRDNTAKEEFKEYRISFWKTMGSDIILAAAEGFVLQDSHSYEIYLIFKSGSTGAVYPNTLYRLHDDEKTFTYGDESDFNPYLIIPDPVRQEQNLSFLPVDKILSVETDIIPNFDQDITNIWDNEERSQFLAFENYNGEIIFTLTSARRIRGISLVNACNNDTFYETTLVSFEVYGSNDKINWTPLHSQTGTADDQISASTNYLERYYELSSNGVYQYYKLVPKNDGMWQVSELYLVYAESDSEN